MEKGEMHTGHRPHRGIWQDTTFSDIRVRRASSRLGWTEGAKARAKSLTPQQKSYDLARGERPPREAATSQAASP
jgi:hypothetical protein